MKKWLFLILFLYLALSLCLDIRGSDASEGGDEIRSFALTGARLVDGTGSPPLENSLVVVESGLITYAGSMTEGWDKPGVKAIDCRGKTVLPGLIDAHIHLGGSGTPVYGYINERRKLAGLLYCGVTSVIDLAGVPELMFDLRKQSEKETLLSPTFFTVGPCFTSPGGHGTEYGVPMAVTPQTESEARSGVANLAADRPNLIKIIYGKGDQGFTSLSYELIQAIIDESHKLGFRVVTHATTLEQAKDAIRAGTDGLAHAVADQEMDSEILTAMKERNVFCIPTLSVFEAIDQLIGGGDLNERLLESALLEKGICKEIYDQLRAGAGKKEGKENRFRRLKTGQVNVRKMKEAGINLVLGTDAGNPWVLFGPSAHRELELLVTAGLTPMEAIVSATRNAAMILGLDAQVGTIEKGKHADILVVDGNPLKEITATQKISMVVRDGRVIDRKGLEGVINPDTAIEEVPKHPAKEGGIKYPAHSLDAATVEKISKAIALLKKGNDTWAPGPMQEAKRLLLGILASGKENDVYPFYYLAMCNYRFTTFLFSQQKITEAGECLTEGREYLEKAMQINPEFAELEALYATFLGYEIGIHPEKAPELGMKSFQYMAQAMKREPENPRIHLLQGTSLLYTPENYGGGIEKALPLLRKAVELFAKIPPPGVLEPGWGYDEALTILGMAYQQMENPKKARECFQNALEINPEYGLAAVELNKMENGTGK